MASFIRSACLTTALVSSKGDQVGYVNDPVNLDLVISYRPSLEIFDFLSNPGKIGHRLEHQLAITFLCVDDIKLVWFYSNESARQEDLARLRAPAGF